MKARQLSFQRVQRFDEILILVHKFLLPIRTRRLLNAMKCDLQSVVADFQTLHLKDFRLEQDKGQWPIEELVYLDEFSRFFYGHDRLFVQVAQFCRDVGDERSKRARILAVIEMLIEQEIVPKHLLLQRRVSACAHLLLASYLKFVQHQLVLALQIGQCATILGRCFAFTCRLTHQFVDHSGHQFKIVENRLPMTTIGLLVSEKGSATLTTAVSARIRFSDTVFATSFFKRTRSVS